MPVLAALRVEPNAFDKANDQAGAMPATADQPAPAVEAARNEPVRNDQIAALRPAESQPTEAIKAAEVPTPAPLAETPPATDAVSPTAVTPASEPATAADARKMTVATAEDMPARIETTKSEPVKGDVIAARIEPIAAPVSQPQENPAITSSETAPATEALDGVAATKIATLGGPPVDVAEETSIPLRTVKLPRARPDQAAIKKRVQARRALQRRRLAALRARLLLQQQQTNPFGQPQPFPQTAAASLAAH
jgi:hypothetical protein